MRLYKTYLNKGMSQLSNFEITVSIFSLSSISLDSKSWLVKFFQKSIPIHHDQLGSINLWESELYEIK